MSVKISRNEISSFKGDVLPIYLTDGDGIVGGAEWSVEGDCVGIKVYPSGVLATLLCEGKGTVTAALNGENYTAEVTVTPAVTVNEGDTLKFFRADLHDHMTEVGTTEPFRARQTEFPSDYLEQIRADGRLDASVITDHSCLLNDELFYRGFTDTERAQPLDTVIFPGSESSMDIIVRDKYGYDRCRGGEIVILNSDSYFCVGKNGNGWDDVFENQSTSPYSIAILAHPQIIAWSPYGMYGFRLDKYNTEKHRELIKYVEIGNGGIRASNEINELVYSTALDNGFYVSTTCSSDSHGPKWGFDVFPGKTMIMAKAKTKADFHDALMNRRVYASESGSVMINYSVNGVRAPARSLPEATSYHFRVELDTIEPTSANIPDYFEVISDYGRVIKTVRCRNIPVLEFDIEAPDARYFYLRIVDWDGKRTWSVPVMTGRAPDLFPTDLKELDKTSFTAVDEKGNDASVIVNGDPSQIWRGLDSRHSFVIDMKTVHTLRAIGHVPRRLIRDEMRKLGLYDINAIAELPCVFRLSVSEDGVSYVQMPERPFRAFSEEEIIPFAPVKARYVKLEILNNAGDNCESPSYRGKNLAIAEINLYE